MAQTPGTFRCESRVYGGSYTRMIGVKCRVCRNEAWKPGENAGWGPRLFKGWLLGRHGAGTDVCPGCRNQKEKRTDLSPAAKRAAYNRIEDKLATSTALTTSISVGEGRQAKEEANPQANTVLADKLKEALEIVTPDPPKEPTPWPVAMHAPWPSRLRTHLHKKDGIIRSTGFTRMANCARAAEKWLTRSGRVYDKNTVNMALDTNGAWMWWPQGFTSPAQVGLTPKTYRDVSKFRDGLRAAGASPPRARTPVNPPVEQTVVVVQRKEAETVPTQTDPPEMTSVRQPSREQRRAILDQLDLGYDMSAQRYNKDGSDQKVAEQLNVPRAWVTSLRTDLYGDFDRNEASDLRAKQLDDMVAKAVVAVDHLLSLATQAEGLLNELKAARAKIK